MSSSLHIRSFRPGDEHFLAAVCCRTADSGKDGTGLLTDDSIWGDLFVLPYAARHPDLAWVVEDEQQHSVVGYCVATPETKAFEEWFGREWWPTRSSRVERRQQPQTTEPARTTAEMMAYGDGRGKPSATPDPFDHTDEYPAHLHINLLPVAQGAGLGRKLIHKVLDGLRERGVKGVSLGTQTANEGACAFYRKIGFVEVPAAEGHVEFAWDFEKR